jgi:hypothetical protein
LQWELIGIILPSIWTVLRNNGGYCGSFTWEWINVWKAAYKLTLEDIKPIKQKQVIVL